MSSVRRAGTPSSFTPTQGISDASSPRATATPSSWVRRLTSRPRSSHSRALVRRVEVLSRRARSSPQLSGARLSLRQRRAGGLDFRELLIDPRRIGRSLLVGLLWEAVAEKPARNSSRSAAGLPAWCGRMCVRSSIASLANVDPFGVVRTGVHRSFSAFRSLPNRCPRCILRRQAGINRGL